MAGKRLIIEMGMGIDQHGQEPIVAAARPVRNAIAPRVVAKAIAHNPLPRVWEVAGLSDPNNIFVEVQIAVPYPEQVKQEEAPAVLPFGHKTLTVGSGGMVVHGRGIAPTSVPKEMAPFNNKNDEMFIAVAAVKVLIES
ncbi:Lin0512 family protein [Umezakia ovalisporum]|uniref:Lin0512 family protein n=1 Tax=Umezakia ovalisporum TaxID=75695 RepID=UPI0035B9BCF7